MTGLARARYDAYGVRDLHSASIKIRIGIYGSSNCVDTVRRLTLDCSQTPPERQSRSSLDFACTLHWPAGVGQRSRPPPAKAVQRLQKVYPRAYAGVCSCVD
jgi:hypothetical protein